MSYNISYRSLSVLDLELNGNLESFPVSGSLSDIVTNLLGRQTKGTDLDKKFNQILRKKKLNPKLNPFTNIKIKLISLTIRHKPKFTKMLFFINFSFKGTNSAVTARKEKV